MLNKTDYFGGKNLYFNVEKKIQSKSLKSLIIENGFKEYSSKGISSYFYFRYPIKTETMFKEYECLDSGIEKLNGKIEYYWKPSFKSKFLNFEKNMNRIEKLLLSSLDKIIKNKKIIGVTLSGGLDSSLIASLVKKYYPQKKLYTYSCGFYGDDEFEYSRKVAKLYSDKHFEIILGKEDFLGEDSIIKSLIKNKCAPLHPNELPLAIIEEKAKKDLCDIVLCGEGADDIFGGYGRNLRIPFSFKGKNEDFYKIFIDKYIYFREEEVKKLLNEKYYHSALDLVSSISEEKEFPQNLENKILYFIQRIHTRGLIERGINALAYNNFDRGFPFIDNHLVDYVNDIPFEQKIAWKNNISINKLKKLTPEEISEKYDIPKFILKKISEKYLPKEIIYRSKKGFPVPFEKWLSDIKEYPLDKDIFKTQDISFLSGWKKYMVINLNYFFDVFNIYKIK